MSLQYSHQQDLRGFLKSRSLAFYSNHCVFNQSLNNKKVILFSFYISTLCRIAISLWVRDPHFVCSLEFFQLSLQFSRHSFLENEHSAEEETLVPLHYYPEITEEMSVHKAGSSVIVVLLVTWPNCSPFPAENYVGWEPCHRTSALRSDSDSQTKALKPLQDFFRLPS